MHMSMLALGIFHATRDLNTWADDLTNHIADQFDPAKQIDLDAISDFWLVLPQLMTAHDVDDVNLVPSGLHKHKRPAVHRQRQRRRSTQQP